MNTKNTVIADAIDRGNSDSYDLLWDCDTCEEETPHNLTGETETSEGLHTMVDTMINCIECGSYHEVSEAVE